MVFLYLAGDLPQIDNRNTERIAGTDTEAGHAGDVDRIGEGF